METNTYYKNDVNSSATSYEHPHLTKLDHEMLAEAHDGQQYSKHPAVETTEQDDHALDQSLAWMNHTGRFDQANIRGELTVPVVVPQTAPGIRNPFSRAWSPVLADHGIQEKDFLAFLDHLNVCKAASPPLQLLNLAGTVVGFLPMVPFAFAISLGVSAASTAGTVAVAKIRIARYLESVNKQYFHPRGLAARIAKQNILPKILHQNPEAPLLAPVPPSASMGSFPDLRTRRLQALGNYIAPIQFEPGSDVSTEHNMLDKLSAKVAARSARKSEQKMMEDTLKDRKDAMEEEFKIEEDLQKARRKGKMHDIAKLEGEKQALHSGLGKGAEKELEAAQKFLFVVIQSLRDAEASAQAEKGGHPG